MFSPRLCTHVRWLCLVWRACVKEIRGVHSVCWRNSGRLSWRHGWTAQSQEIHTSTSTSCIPPVPSSACTAGTSSSPSSQRRPTGTLWSLLNAIGKHLRKRWSTAVKTWEKYMRQTHRPLANIWGILHWDHKLQSDWLVSSFRESECTGLSVCWEIKLCLRLPSASEEEQVAGFANVCIVLDINSGKDIQRFDWNI